MAPMALLKAAFVRVQVTSKFNLDAIAFREAITAPRRRPVVNN